jgi:dolichyl-phosphate beta-glucosyltransferase
MSDPTPTAPDLSVVIPVYDSAAFIEERLGALCDALEAQDASYEVIVVDDGSADDSAERVRRAAQPHVRLLSLPSNQGKFAALVAGMAECRGRCHLFTDADVPYEPSLLATMANRVLEGGVHMVIGDRNLPDSVYSEELNPVRAAATRLFTLLVRLFVTRGLPDTQCGMKAFRADVARSLFPLLRERGFAGDVELVFLAVQYGLAIERMPVRLVFQGQSSVHPMRDGISMLRAILAVRRRFRRGGYASPELAALGREARAG